ncbi:MAG: sigma-70 family RNA polymerase sigma factor [Hyphomicrobiaceae bacterium]
MGPGPGVDDGERDSALIARMGAGDTRAFADLVGRHLGAVLSVSRRMLGDDAEAEDVAQETMLKLWRLADGLAIGPAGVRPWLRRVAGNLCIDRIRRRAQTEVTDAPPEVPVAPGQMRALDDRDRAARVEQALQALPDRQRLALVLFHYEGLSQIEIADQMGIGDEAVESLLARARRSLRRSLETDWRALLGDQAGEGV